MLQVGQVLLLDQQAKRADYLQSIFEFVDVRFECFDAAASLAERLSDAEGIAGLLVLLPTDIEQEAVDTLKQVVADSSPRPLMLRVLDDEADGPPEDVLDGSIGLPLRYTQLTETLARAAERQTSTPPPGAAVESQQPFRGLSGSGPATTQINRMIAQVAGSDATVLVLGESGTGKEVVAKTLHLNSTRRHMPFVPVNCGAIPADLLESELFGHEKGAFTGAISARKGRFELANGGTLFLDEIGDMSMPMQVKLLRVLQERTFERVGSNKTIECDVRIIAATHRDLESAISEEKFREDLFYRLNVFPIEMPPLRERGDDIAVLIKDLVARIEAENRGSVRFTPAAVLALKQYQWPGNVRELANLIERLAILYPYGVVDLKDLPEKFRADLSPEELANLPQVAEPEIAGEPVDSAIIAAPTQLPSEGIDLKVHLSNLEMGLIQQALDDADGVVAHAAKRLKMRRTTLVEKLRKYGLQRA